MANIPNKFTPSPKELTSSSWLVFISGGSNLKMNEVIDDMCLTVEMWTYSLWIASKIMKSEIKTRKMPLANPDNVSIRP